MKADTSPHVNSAGSHRSSRCRSAFVRRNVSRERALSTSPRVEKIDLRSALVYLSLTPTILSSTIVGWDGKYRRDLDGVGLAAEFFRQRHFVFRSRERLVDELPRWIDTFACGRSASSFCQTSFFLLLALLPDQPRRQVHSRFSPSI